MEVKNPLCLPFFQREKEGDCKKDNQWYKRKRLKMAKGQNGRQERINKRRGVKGAI